MDKKAASSTLLPSCEEKRNGHNNEEISRSNKHKGECPKVALKHIDKADPKEMQCVAAANLSLNHQYHEMILAQANRSFWCALVSASVGFLLFLGAATFLMWHLTQVAVIGTVGAAITTVISGTTFYLYRCAMRSCEDIHQCLERTELLLLGNSLCKQIQCREQQTDAYRDLISNVTHLTVSLHTSEHKQRPPSPSGSGDQNPASADRQTP